MLKLIRHIFKLRGKSRIKKLSKLDRLALKKFNQTVKHPKRKNGQFSRKIPVNCYTGERFYIYL